MTLYLPFLILSDKPAYGKLVQYAFKHNPIEYGSAAFNPGTKYAGIIFCGGPHISPCFYGGVSVVDEHYDYERDCIECAIYTIAKARRIPMFGICRGMQFLWAMDGGSLTDVVGHNKITHPVFTLEGQMKVYSEHRQVIMPYRRQTVFSLDAWCDGYPEAISNKLYGIYAVQWHSERMSMLSGGAQYFINLLRKHADA